MSIKELAAKHNIDPEIAKAFLREWLDMQPVKGYLSRHGSFVGADTKYRLKSDTPLISRTLGE